MNLGISFLSGHFKDLKNLVSEGTYQCYIIKLLQHIVKSQIILKDIQ